MIVFAVSNSPRWVSVSMASVVVARVELRDMETCFRNILSNMTTAISNAASRVVLSWLASSKDPRKESTIVLHYAPPLPNSRSHAAYFRKDENMKRENPFKLDLAFRHVFLSLTYFWTNVSLQLPTQTYIFNAVESVLKCLKYRSFNLRCKSMKIL